MIAVYLVSQYKAQCKWGDLIHAPNQDDKALHGVRLETCLASVKQHIQ